MSAARERVPAVVIRAADGEQVIATGVEHLFKLTGGQTGGRFGFEESTVPPGVLGARSHIHWAHDEYFYVLSGQLTVATESGEVVLGPGDLAHAPRGSVHGFRNADPAVPARTLVMYTPPGYEQYFRDVHAALDAGAEISDETLARLRSRYDTDSL
jgi:quercetin dioxygenase-like cupin family protein